MRKEAESDFEELKAFMKTAATFFAGEELGESSSLGRDMRKCGVKKKERKRESGSALNKFLASGIKRRTFRTPDVSSGRESSSLSEVLIDLPFDYCSLLTSYLELPELLKSKN